MAENGEIHEPCSEIANFFMVKKLSSNAIMPCRGSSLSAGYDLFSAAEAKVPARGEALIPIDISIAIPKDTYGRIDFVVAKDLDSTIRGAGGFGSTGLRNFHLNCAFHLQNPKRSNPYSFISLPVQSSMAENSEIHEQLLPVQNNMAGEIHKPCCKIAKLSEEATLSPSFEVKKLSSNAILPSRCSSFSAGYDLFSAADVKVPARGRALIPTDLSIAIPKNTYAQIAPRLGLAWKHSIKVRAGVIDADYRDLLVLYCPTVHIWILW